jgi:hypothetical protein
LTNGRSSTSLDELKAKIEDAETQFATQAEKNY